MTTLSSKNNLIIKKVSSLKEKKGRDLLSLFLIEGPNLVRELMDFGGRPCFIFIKAGASKEIRELANRIDEPSAVYELTEDVFKKISSEDNPQGIIAVVEKKKNDKTLFFSSLHNKNILILDRLQDPGNIGTLIRSAEALGFGGIIFLKGCADAYSPKLVKAAAGSLMRIPTLFIDNIDELFKLLDENSYFPYAACMNGKETLYEVDLRKKIALIIGNEGNGVCDEILLKSHTISIPMDGKLESLNAAIAGTLIMYESKRQSINERTIK